MKISVFGMGYVGCVTAAVLSKDHEVIGVDVNPGKVDLLNSGLSPISEAQTDELISSGVKEGRLSATMDPVAAVLSTDVSVVCVGTPSTETGSHDLSQVEGVLAQITSAIESKETKHVVVLRSTVPPGTTERLLTEKLAGANVGICFNPEFLREGTAVADYYDPPFIIAACSDGETEAAVREMYAAVDADFIVTGFPEAETVKIFCNIFHALKVAFGNEVGRFCEAYDIDGSAIMEMLCKDTKLNISPKYLMPGFAFGGSCLPKDLRSLVHLAAIKSVPLPVIGNVLPSNEAQIRDGIQKIVAAQGRKVAFIGLSFKQGTDDLRESPYVRLAEHFIGKGYDVRIYDKDVTISKLVGSNKAYIEDEIAHISSVLVDDASAISDCDIVVLCKSPDASVQAVLEGKTLVDLR